MRCCPMFPLASLMFAAMLTLGLPPAVAQEEYSMVFPTVEVAPGDDLSIPIDGTWLANVQGYTVGLTFTPSPAIANLNFEIEDTLTGELGPEFVNKIVDPAAGQAVLVVLFELFPPININNILPPLDFPLALAFLTGTVDEEAEAGLIPFDFTDGLGSPPANNLYVVDNQSFPPTTKTNGSIQIIPELFIRGDADLDTSIALTDALKILLFLFLGGTTPECADAADSNDSGDIEITDALHILEYLFSSGAPMPPPHLAPGVDPTDDSLDCATPLS